MYDIYIDALMQHDGGIVRTWHILANIFLADVVQSSKPGIVHR